ncbi:GNAT family N-acetyltransferase [Lacinutrix sp. WUR7]|uniref:GNAT family N-acetyltransferase n=1 Tax=Lacinutrix sp. WUR7 TaxID=2653681 RepID=UPI001EF02814|nr:GNAT family N-acetyltransferase [Lacinutrix sp. WUR7]
MEYHQDRFDDFSLLIYKNDKLIAVLPANITNENVFSHQGLTYGGLVVSEKLKLKDVARCLKAVLNYYKEKGVKTLQLKQFPSIYSLVPNDEMQYLMFVLQAELIKRDTLSVLNLKYKPKLSKDRIAGNKRALKQNLEVKEVAEFDAFWNTILIPNLNAKHEAQPVHSLQEIKNLKNKFPKNIRQFNVYQDNVLVAGTTIFETNQVAHSQYISGNADKNVIGSLDFLHLYLINEVFKDKAYFDFGISNENQSKNINQGLQYWKEGFGARTITQDFHQIDLKNMDNLDTIFI